MRSLKGSKEVLGRIPLLVSASWPTFGDLFGGVGESHRVFIFRRFIRLVILFVDPWCMGSSWGGNSRLGVGHKGLAFGVWKATLLKLIAFLTSNRLGLLVELPDILTRCLGIRGGNQGWDLIVQFMAMILHAHVSDVAVAHLYCWVLLIIEILKQERIKVRV